jgi:hypothetical protein
MMRMVIKMVMMVFIGRFLLSISYRQNTKNSGGGRGYQTAQGTES